MILIRYNFYKERGLNKCFETCALKLIYVYIHTPIHTHVYVCVFIYIEMWANHYY